MSQKKHTRIIVLQGLEKHGDKDNEPAGQPSIDECRITLRQHGGVEADYKKLSATRISEDLQTIRKNLNEIENAAATAAHEIIPFKFEEFREDFIKGHPLIIQKSRKPEPVIFSGYIFDIKPYERRISLLREIHPDKDYISVTFLSCIRTLLEQGRIGSALNYQDAYNSLKCFRGNVRFEEITVSYLNLFEQWMVNVKKNSLTTVGIKLRALRAVLMKQLKMGSLKEKNATPLEEESIR